jgi:lipopolysaccharide export system permease protein
VSRAKNSVAYAFGAPDHETGVKTLHTYLTRQIVASLVVSVAIFTVVLLLGNLLNEILPPLIKKQVSFGVVAEAIGLLIPFVWVFALPMGMLTATLLIFGRFSADQELTAVRASGISLLSLISPILLLSLALCALSALFNMELGPRCRTAYTRLIFRIGVELSSAQLLPEGRFIKDFKGENLVSVGKNRNGVLEDITVYQIKNNTNVVTLRAPRGKIELDAERKVINLYLYDTKGVWLTDGRIQSGDLTIQIDMKQPKQNERPGLSNMTFMQLRDELRDLERWLSFPLARNLSPEQLRAVKQNMQKQKKDLTTPIRVHIYRQVAFSFASFGFTLIGIPLGIRVHRRETNIGIAMALLLVLVYYSFVLLGSALDTRPEFAPQLIVWLPNFVFQAVGAVLLWRANRGV